MSDTDTNVDPPDDSEEGPTFENPDPPAPDWLDSTTLYLVSVTWHDQQDIAMHEQQLVLLADEQTDGLLVSTTTGPA